MTDTIGFRPSEKAERIITEYMTKHNLDKEKRGALSEALNEIIEGRFSLSSLPPQTPTTTPLTPPLVFSANKPRDCSVCRERCNVDYHHCPNGLNDRPAPQP